MDFYDTHNTYILRKGKTSLWCNRVNGNLQVRPDSDIDLLEVKPNCLGRVYGVVGKIQFLPDSDEKLVLITKHYKVGEIADKCPIYRIEKIAVVPLSSEECPDIDFDLCEEHGDQSASRQAPQPKVAQTLTNLRTSLTNWQFNKTTANKMNSQKTVDKEKLERRLQEEFIKMFNDSQSFYYSENADLTNSVQRNVKKDDKRKNEPVWKTADNRFFWNKAMLEEIMALSETDASAHGWIVPVIQGYVQTALCEVDYSESGMNEEILRQTAAEKFDLILISRRSVSRAGTRYKRRGVDEEGNVANYVETEQIVRAGAHFLSFVQLRGSIPLYWSQAGIKYRPPPKLERNKEESQDAMKKHLEKELALFKNVTIINLVEQSGREQVLYDAFMEHIITYNNNFLAYVTFDFHEYCRGMKFENVSKLVEAVAKITDNMRFSWVDHQGMIWEQQGVFRVNCMDCLDRTNVVQAALARYVLETQLSRLGRLMPENSLPADIRDVYQDMWANNGDAISRQYAGTAAMKGDFTRTGERKFTGVMKDGYHSANRYLNRFTAAYRQTVIDIMLGISPTEDIKSLIDAMKQPEETGEEWTLQREEWVAQLVERCHQLLVQEGEIYLGGWALIEPIVSNSEEEGSVFEQEIVLLLTEKAFYIACYDEEEAYVNQYECIPLENLEKIEMGPNMSQRSQISCLRLHYRSNEDGGYFHTFKALRNRTVDEDKDVLHGIADEFQKAMLAKNLKAKVIECRLSKKKTKPHEVIQLSCKTRPCSADNHYRCKNVLCAPKEGSMVHSCSAPAKLDKMAARLVSLETNDSSKPDILDQGTSSISNGSRDDSALYKRVLSAGSSNMEGTTFIKDLESNLEWENGNDTSCSAVENKNMGSQEVHLHGKAKQSKHDDFMAGNEPSLSSLCKNNTDQDTDCVITGQKMSGSAFSTNENELYKARVLPSNDNQNVSEELNIAAIAGQSDLREKEKQAECCENDKEAFETKDTTDKQNVISSEKNIDTRENFGQTTAVDMSKTSDKNDKNWGEKSLMSKFFETGKKLSSANNSPKMARKSESSGKTSDPESSLAANFKKNLKNRFADAQIRFRKNEDSVNASEVEWKAEDSEGVPEPARPAVGKRNILAAAQERGRAFIPELKNKFSGLSNRSPRMARKTDWKTVIENSECRTNIILV
ncbi:phosphatidylinositide phosphatase SAC2-like [Dendronephthya gigantea]|uniref:phosphatidylinositide phosphatase SAC2-like n=1 Tax=Dendronephthya gigantea TaxID=151771 RepID=UPI00106DA86E|nr:phosphatidylinositide phosphatase SAC2-like [Dendronephthya gigantea]